MNCNALLKYLRQAVELETAIYQQELARQAVHEKMECLGVKACIMEPDVPRFTKQGIDSVLGKTSPGFWKGLAVFAGFAAFLGVCSLPRTLNDGSGGMSSFLMLFLLCFVGVAILIFLIDGVKLLIAHSKNLSTKKEYQENTTAAQEIYELARKNEAERQYAEDVLKDELMRADEEMTRNIDQLAAVLHEHYQSGVLYPTYRNMIAVTQLLEYIESGIATSLEGSNGAYAQYLQDVRTNRICSRLEDISAQLNLIIRNQNLLAQRLSAVQNAVDEMNASLGKNEENIRSIAADVSLMRYSLIDANDYLENALPKLQQITDAVNVIAFNSNVSALNDYRQATIDRYRLEYPIH